MNASCSAVRCRWWVVIGIALIMFRPEVLAAY